MNNKKIFIMLMILLVMSETIACQSDDEENNILNTYNYSGQKIVQDKNNESEKDIPLDYNLAYADYLEQSKLYDDFSAGTYKNSTGQIVYSLEYIDNDEIPELIFGRTDQQVQASCYILTYKNGDVKCVGPIGPYNGFSFYQKGSMIIENTVIEGFSVYSYLVLKEDGSLENVGEAWLSESLDNQEEIYYINDNQVQKEEFYEYVVTADSSECINWNSADNSNNYTLISGKTIKEIKNMNIKTQTQIIKDE